MSNAVARALRRLGIDVETTAEAGLIAASDRAHLTHARANGRVTVTLDEDFAQLHYEVQLHSGIVYFPHGRQSIGEIVESLLLVHAAFSAEEMVGRLEWM
jgi:predicted nuclease of predicted toxin-antitoxin system